MKPLLVLFLLPVLIGVVSTLCFRTMKNASFAATMVTPLVVFLCVMAFDPRDAWSSLGALLMAPLVIAVAVITVLLCAGRAHVRKRSDTHGNGVA